MSQDDNNPYGTQEPVPPNPYDGSYAVYDNPAPYGSAPLLLKIAGIVNIVMAGIDILYAALWAIVAICVATGALDPQLANLPERPAVAPGDIPNSVLVAVILGIGVLALAAGLLKLIGGIKILRRSSGAWGFGLVSGILGCLQIWCSYLCLIPLAVGVFTIVVLSLENSRRYLRENPASGAGPSPLP